MFEGFPADGLASPVVHFPGDPEDTNDLHDDLWPEPPVRRHRGGLEEDIVDAITGIRDGTIAAPNGPLTPYRVSRVVQARGNLTHRPSTGGTTDAFKRLETYGAITTQVKPYAFVAFTEAFLEHGLAELRHRCREETP